MREWRIIHVGMYKYVNYESFETKAMSKSLRTLTATMLSFIKTVSASKTSHKPVESPKEEEENTISIRYFWCSHFLLK